MFNKVDRILVAVHDLNAAEKNYRDVLGATPIEEFKSEHLNANVRRMAIGISEVELCQPLGAGPVETYLEGGREGLMCGGVTTADLDVFAEVLKEHNTVYTKADGRLYLEGGDLHGLPLVVSTAPKTPVDRVPGPVDYLYELTMVLSTRWQDVAATYSKRLAIDPENMVGITFKRFGYEGTLMLFDPQNLDRIELSEAHDTAFPMGRFSAKNGDALYMCYIETNDLAGIIQRLDQSDHRYTRRTDTPVEQDGLWIHPSALNGVLLGVSRTTLAWHWSGRPDRVAPLDQG